MTWDIVNCGLSIVHCPGGNLSFRASDIKRVTGVEN